MNTYKYIINGHEIEVDIVQIEDNKATVSVNGEEFLVEMENAPQPEKKAVVEAVNAVQTEDSDTSSKKVNAADATKAPLPGVITSIEVSVGQDVNVGDTIVVLEAMKMANNIEAEKNGKVTAIYVKQGESVLEDAPLFLVE